MPYAETTPRYGRPAMPRDWYDSILEDTADLPSDPLEVEASYELAALADWRQLALAESDYTGD